MKRTLQYLQDKDLHVNGLVVVGGVAANLELRRRLLDLLELNQGDNAPMKLIFPPVKLCTDNGVMSAWAGIEKFNLGVSNVKENQDVLAKWPLGTPVVDPLKTTYTSNHSPSSQGKQTRKANTNSTAV